MGIGERILHAWNAFRNNRDPTSIDLGMSSMRRPDRVRFSFGNERSIITAMYNRIAIDVAAVSIQHVRTDQNGSYVETIESSLNSVLNLDANIDQTGRAFIQDIVMSMFDEGCVAIVPTDTSINPAVSDSYIIDKVRVGKIIEWFPEHVRVRLYNEKKGIKEDILVLKRTTAIVENPLYAVMNEPNSTLQRLIRKLNILDAIDEQSGSGKLDLIIQLPYVIKSPSRKAQAEERRKDMETQLTGSKYGIAYTDGTERITQLNRPAENNLMSQIQYLTSMLHSQLGLTTNVFDGTADEKEMLNYYNRTIEPILEAIVAEMKRKFLTKTARTQLQSIMWFRNPMKLAPVTELANIFDKFSRNEILSGNELRGVIGYKPSNDPRADELRNKNLNAADSKLPKTPPVEGDESDEDDPVD